MTSEIPNESHDIVFEYGSLDLPGEGIDPTAYSDTERPLILSDGPEPEPKVDLVHDSDIRPHDEDE